MENEETAGGVLLHEPVTRLGDRIGPQFPPVAGCKGCALYRTLAHSAFEMGERRVGLRIGREQGMHLIKDHGAVPDAPENVGGF